MVKIRQAAEEVRQLPVHGDGGGGGQEVGAENPAVPGDPSQLGHHRRHGRAHGCGLQGGQEHGQGQGRGDEFSGPSGFHVSSGKGDRRSVRRRPLGPVREE